MTKDGSWMQVDGGMKGMGGSKKGMNMDRELRYLSLYR